MKCSTVPPSGVSWLWHHVNQLSQSAKHQCHLQQVCTSLQTDNHASTLPLSFYRPDALPAAQPTASKHWRLQTNPNWKCDGECSTNHARSWVACRHLLEDRQAAQTTPSASVSTVPSQMPSSEGLVPHRPTAHLRIQRHTNIKLYTTLRRINADRCLLHTLECCQKSDEWCKKRR